MRSWKGGPTPWLSALGVCPNHLQSFEKSTASWAITTEGTHASILAVPSERNNTTARVEEVFLLLFKFRSHKDNDKRRKLPHNFGGWKVENEQERTQQLRAGTPPPSKPHSPIAAQRPQPARLMHAQGPQPGLWAPRLHQGHRRLQKAPAWRRQRRDRKQATQGTRRPRMGRNFKNVLEGKRRLDHCETAKGVSRNLKYNHRGIPWRSSD